MTLTAVKLRRDLRASWGRFALMTVAIAVTLTAVGAVLFAWGAASRETKRAYLSTEPASATLLLDRPVDEQQLIEIAQEAQERPRVLQATARTQFTTDVAINGRASDLPLQVFVAPPDDALAMARFFMDERAWPPHPDEIYLSGDSLSLMGVSDGDVLAFESPAGEELEVRVADTVYDPSLSPSPQEQTGRAYLSSSTLGRGRAPALLDQLKVQVADSIEERSSSDREEIVEVASDVATWLQDEYALTVREIQVPTPLAHPHQWQADTLLGSLLAGAAAALLLSTILVANMLNNLFIQQVPQIGIMKAIGAAASRIARLYLGMTLIVALAATALALGPATALGRVAVTNFLGFLGIEPQTLAPPAWTYFAVVGLGLVLPPLMTLPPLVKASRITVRAAIDHRGLGSKPSAATGLLARLSRFPWLDRGLLMALRNTVRRPARFLLSVGLLATAGTVFVAGMSLSAGVEAIAEEQKETRTWDVDVQLVSPVARERIDRIVSQVDGVTGMDAFTVAPAGIAGPGEVPVTRTYPDQGHGRISVTALPPDARTFEPPTMLEGRWLEAGETGVIVLNQVTRKNTVPGVGAGDEVQLIVGGKTNTWRVVGIAQERQSHRSGVYTTSEGLGRAMGQPDDVNSLRIFTDESDEETRERVAADVENELGQEGITVASAASISRSEAISEGHLGPVVLILLGVAIPLGVVGVIGLASTMSANVLDRIREFGMMHAIGALPKTVRRIVVAEGIFLAVTSCIVAILPALGMIAVLGAGLGNLFFSAPLPYRVSFLAVGIWSVLVVLGAMLATDAAASRASRLTVREALAYL